LNEFPLLLSRSLFEEVPRAPGRFTAATKKRLSASSVLQGVSASIIALAFRNFLLVPTAGTLQVVPKAGCSDVQSIPRAI